ncbi:MAG TPA: DNA starvation/stationary phase protection protein Dps [Gemmatimonadaceae bacterium]|jgi:starvation-inducible DNA-binding protein
MHPTHNTIPEHTRSQVIEILSARLMDSSDLYFQAKTAHWNVKGPNFIALHKLFDKLAECASEWSDLIAERLVQLGGQAEGTVQVVTERTSLEPYPPTIVDEHEHVHAISAVLAQFGELLRDGIEKTDELEDMGSSDLLIDVARDVDKLLWFVEAHLGSEVAHASAHRRAPARGQSTRR